MKRTAGRPDSGVGGTQAISRAFAVLHLFRDRGASIGVVEVAKELGLTLGTAHRLIRVLVAEGYLCQNEDTDRYDLGGSAFILGQAAQESLGLNVVRPLLQRLSDETGESVNLGMLVRGEAAVALRVESPQPLRFSQTPGDRIRLHATSIGKALLAFNRTLEVEFDRLDEPLCQLTPKTLATKKVLRRDLALIRKRGWSIDDEESIVGVRCIGAPILDSNGEAYAGIALQAPAVRMPDERFAELAPLVVEVGREIARLLPSGEHLGMSVNGHRVQPRQVSRPIPMPAQ